MYHKGRLLMRSIDMKNEKKTITLRPKKVAKILIENKMVFLNSIYFSMHHRPKRIVFYELVENIVPQNKRFDFYNVGYASDIAITMERANALSDALKDLGYKTKQSEWMIVDNEDYLLYLENELGSTDYKKYKSKKYLEEKKIDYYYYKGYSGNVKKDIGDIIEEYRNENIQRNDPNELKMKSILEKLGINYEFQKVFYVSGKFYIADFYVPENRVIIEVDGDSHNEIDRLKKDRERDNLFARHGILTLRFDCNDAFYEISSESVLKKLLIPHD